MSEASCSRQSTAPLSTTNSYNQQNTHRKLTPIQTNKLVPPLVKKKTQKHTKLNLFSKPFLRKEITFSWEKLWNILKLSHVQSVFLTAPTVSLRFFLELEQLLDPNGSGGLQIYLVPRVTLTFDLLTPKLDRFMPLSVEHLCHENRFIALWKYSIHKICSQTNERTTCEDNVSSRHAVWPGGADMDIKVFSLSSTWGLLQIRAQVSVPVAYLGFQ